jgi:type I restriction enzyme S subunit
MSALPLGWSSAQLGDLAEYHNGAAFKPTDWGTKGTPIIRIQNLTDPSKPLHRTTRVVDDRLRVSDGDILVSWSASLDAFIWNRGKAWLNQHIFRVVPREERIDKRFLFFMLRREIATLLETEHLHGSTMKHINRGPFLSHSVALPPLDEQRRIVAKLDNLFNSSKIAREELAHIPRLVERYKQAVLASAFRGELTAQCRSKASTKPKAPLAVDLATARSATFREARIKERPTISPSWTPDIDLPKTWEFVSVDQLTTLVQYGSSAKTSESSTKGVPVLRMGNIFEGQLDYTNLKYLPASHDEFPELLLQDGDILFNRTNSAELVGKTAVYSDVGHATSFASYLIRLRVVGYLPELLSAYINSAFGREWVRSVVNQQVGQANVNGTKLRELGVPLMPIDEQKEIWSRIKQAFTRIEHLSKEATRATELLDRLDRATLAKAFRGELVENHPPSASRKGSSK